VLPTTRVVEGSLRPGTSSTRERRARVTALDVLGWAGSALLVYSVLQTGILRLRLFNCVASALLVIFNALRVRLRGSKTVPTLEVKTRPDSVQAGRARTLRRPDEIDGSGAREEPMEAVLVPSPARLTPATGRIGHR
jgi:hypothetical protein